MPSDPHVPLRAIVTGGTRGIGRAIAEALLAAGAHVMMTGRDRDAVDTAVQALASREPGRASRVAGTAVDVRDAAAVTALVEQTVRRFGGLNVLVNNAGVSVHSNVESMTDEDWGRVIETNVSGPFHCMRAAIPVLKAAGGGWIINIASLAGRNPYAGGGAYCASKAALISLTESVMQEVRADDIRVTVIMPGSVATEFGGRPPDAGDTWKLAAEDVADAVMHVIRQPARALSSRVEIRPSKPRTS